MTTLKTPEEASQYFRTVVDIERARIMVTQDRQHIAEVLCDLLEGEIEALEHHQYCPIKDVPKEVASCGCWHQREETFRKAQALIRQTLDPISSNER